MTEIETKADQIEKAVEWVRLMNDELNSLHPDDTNAQRSVRTKQRTPSLVKEAELKFGISEKTINRIVNAKR